MLAAREQGGKDIQIGCGKQSLCVGASHLGGFEYLRARSLRYFDRRCSGGLRGVEEKADMAITGQGPQVFDADSGE